MVPDVCEVHVSWAWATGVKINRVPTKRKNSRKVRVPQYMPIPSWDVYKNSLANFLLTPNQEYELALTKTIFFISYYCLMGKKSKKQIFMTKVIRINEFGPGVPI